MGRRDHEVRIPTSCDGDHAVQNVRAPSHERAVVSERNGVLHAGRDRTPGLTQRAQNRITTCKEHDNLFAAVPNATGKVKSVAARAGLEPWCRDLLQMKP